MNVQPHVLSSWNNNNQFSAGIIPMPRQQSTVAQGATLTSSALSQALYLKQGTVQQQASTAAQTTPYERSGAPNLSTSPQLFPSLKYGSTPAAQANLVPLPADQEQNPNIAGYVATPPEAGELKDNNVANAFTSQWQEQVQQAAERNGGLGNAEDGFLAWSSNGFVRLKNESLTAEQNRRLAEISLTTGTKIEDLPSRTTDDTVDDPKTNEWVDTFIQKHDSAMAQFLADPTQGYSVKDGKHRYEMKLDQESGLVASYHYKKHGGLRGFFESNLKGISKVCGWVSTIGSFIPGWGTVAALAARGVQALSTVIATGKLKGSGLLSSIASGVASFVPGVGGLASRIAGGIADVWEKGKAGISSLVSSVTGFYGSQVSPWVQGAINLAGNAVSKGKVTIGDAISSLTTMVRGYLNKDVSQPTGVAAQQGETTVQN